MYNWSTKTQRRYRDSEKFTLAMYHLATIMNEDFDVVTRRFNALVRHTYFSWKEAYSFAYYRASRGIRDPWFYDSKEKE